MMHSLMFWKGHPTIDMAPAAIAQELSFGEEVEGLIDLPIREFLDRIIAAFPRCEEHAGLVIVPGENGPIEATWTWQVLRLQHSNMSDADRERLLEIGREFGSEGYDA
jgi:hypothetical protein